MTSDKNNSPVTAPMWWDGGDRAITAREKATIEEHGPSCFSIALLPATPSARWAADGLPDPHAGRYACERAALTLGNLTDDELANAVYLHGNEQPSMADLVAGKALSGIVYLTAAKDRIRWLSRALAATCKQPLQAGEVHGDALTDAVGRIFGCDGSPYRTRDLVAVLREFAALAAHPAQGVDLGPVREFLRRRMAQWRSHLPSDPDAPGTVAISGDGEGSYNNDVRMYREGIALMDRVLALIDDQRDPAPEVGNGD